jgi:hypothetical protein
MEKISERELPIGISMFFLLFLQRIFMFSLIVGRILVSAGKISKK